MKRGLGLLVCVLPALTWAQNYLPFKMLSTASNPFPYYVDSRRSSIGGVPLAEAQAASDNAWNSWNKVVCASPKVISKGLTGTVITSPGDPNNGSNVTPVFITSSSDPDYSRTVGSAYVVAITLPLTYSGILLNCNIFINSVGYSFSTGPTTAKNSVDVETVMLHEDGHCLGLDHFFANINGTEENVMWSAVNPGSQKRGLTAPDVSALCNRNPVGGATGAPCFDGGTCDPGGTCYTQTLPDAPHRFCTKPCNVNTNEACPLPLTCTASTFLPNSTGACLFPSGNVTPVGKACTNATDCVSALGTCLKPEATPSGHQYWAAGYCSQSCETGQPACPAGSTCATLGDNTHMCLASCRPGLADCRSNYACVLSTAGGVCVGQCYTNVDCQNANVDCRTCDGVCVAKQNVSAQIGDLCSQDPNCGAGQTCLVVAPSGSSLPQCTQQCGRGCGLCPAGASCISTTKGLNCLRDCTGPNTCPTGLRCADFPSAKGCVPMCVNDIECPVGQHCNGGECLNDVDDAGCGTLCKVPDAGRPIVVPNKDGGTDTTPIRPCGCDGSPGSMGLMFVLAVLVSLMRRSAWRQ